MQKSKGFTLVELVIVIVILGILAVTAAPKFLNLAGDAKKGTLDAVKASLQSSNGVIYSKAVLQGKHKVQSATVNETGVTNGIAVAYGYVAGTKAAVEAVLDLDGNFLVDPGVDNTNLSMTTAEVMIYPKDTTKPDGNTQTTAACVLVYKAATSSAKPTYTVFGDGC